MTFQFGQDLEMDQLRTSHNITKILTTPFGKKEGCDDNTKSNDKGGVIRLSPHFRNHPTNLSYNFSLKSRDARPQNKLNMCRGFNSTTGFLGNHSPSFDTSLDSNSIKLKEGYK